MAPQAESELRVGIMRQLGMDVEDEGEMKNSDIILPVLATTKAMKARSHFVHESHANDWHTTPSRAVVSNQAGSPH